MLKDKKKLIIIIASAAGALAVLLIVLFATGVFGKKAVNVYPVSAFAMDGMIWQTDESSGYVRVEGIQNVELSTTQIVNEIYVSPGQHVEAGDAILSYDTTLSDLALERSALDISKAELALNRAYGQLSYLNSLSPSSDVLIEPDNSWIKYDPVATPYLLKGTGTQTDPMFYMVDDSNVFDNAFFSGIIPPGAGETYIVFLTRKNNAVNAPIQKSFSLIIYPKDGGYAFKPFDAFIPADIEKYDKPADPYYEHTGSEYNAEELARLRARAAHDVRECEIRLQRTKLDHQKKLVEKSDNVVRATTAGTVNIVRDPGAALSQSKPVVEIASGGGYFVDLNVSEFKLKEIHKGDKVTITSYSTGKECEGTIASISKIPSAAKDETSFSDNPNVSYYPYTVFVPPGAYLSAGDYVRAQVSSEDGEKDSLYLEKMFVLREKGKSYIYIQDENGKLKKKEIKTGRMLLGNLILIKDGLSGSDLIAFPYGKDLKDGAPCREMSPESLYEN